MLMGNILSQFKYVLSYLHLPLEAASFSGTSRVRSSFTVDPSARSVSQPITRSDPTVFYGLKNPTPGGVGLPPAVKTGSPEGKNDNISFSGDKAFFDFSHSGKDPLTPGFATPALDVHAALSYEKWCIDYNGFFYWR